MAQDNPKYKKRRQLPTPDTDTGWCLHQFDRMSKAVLGISIGMPLLIILVLLP